MTVVLIILIVLAAVLVIFLVGGLLASRRRLAAPGYAAHVAQADQALEEARASDRGWDRELLEAAARRALNRERSGVAYAELHLVLVDDRPGVTEDRAHFVASGGGPETRLVLARREEGWELEHIE